MMLRVVRHVQSYAVWLEVPPAKLAEWWVCGQAARPAKLGSRGCQSPGWVVRVCGRGARVMCAGVQAAEPAEAAAAKKDVRDS